MQMPVVIVIIAVTLGVLAGCDRHAQENMRDASEMSCKDRPASGCFLGGTSKPSSSKQW